MSILIYLCYAVDEFFPKDIAWYYTSTPKDDKIKTTFLSFFRACRQRSKNLERNDSVFIKQSRQVEN